MQTACGASIHQEGMLQCNAGKATSTCCSWAKASGLRGVCCTHCLACSDPLRVSLCWTATSISSCT